MEGHVTWPMLETMYDYWDQNPPVHIMVAAYLGLGNKGNKGRKGKGGKAAGKYQDHSELLNLFGNQNT